MPVSWSAKQLEAISRSDELQIATRRTDSTLRSWIPIWVVCAGRDVRATTADGRLIDLAMTLGLLKHPDGTAAGAVAVLRPLVDVEPFAL